MTKAQPRQPKGVPVGGQWRATSRPEGTTLSNSATVWADGKGQFALSGGGRGNPGCDECGEKDAVVRHDGRYLCAEGARAAGVIQGELAFSVSYTVRSGITDKAYCSGTVTVAAPDRQTAARRAVDWAWDHDPYCDDRAHPIVRVRRAVVVGPADGLHCHHCGGPCAVDGNGALWHLSEDGGPDRAMDADHAPDLKGT